VLKGKKQSTFPYNLKELRLKNGKYSLIIETPFGNTLLTELVKATLKGEQLGHGTDTDFLTISFSSTDYIGHNYGIRSKELEDTYVRMDREIAVLLETFDKEIGAGNYTLFLTADHGASDHPNYLNQRRLPGKFYNSKKIKDSLNNYLSKKFGVDNYVSSIDKTQIYFATTKTLKKDLIEAALKYLKTIEGVKEAFAPEFPEMNILNSSIGKIIRNSYHPENSGDILLHFYAGWMAERTFGTTHGNAYTTDTHVPLVWYGWGIAAGESVAQHTITQIAPTLSLLLNIPFPSASDTHPIKELFKR
jgi:predicted AlkP superfamily pyrophosphatase or phosphodiesterase